MKRSTLQLVLLLAVSSAAMAEGPATVSGTVRDSSGATQMGTLVQLLGPAHNVLAEAFTDDSGHYSLVAPISGTFELRASAALFLPAVANNLTIQAGANAVVNLTLTTLNDALQWLPAERRPANEPADEWKWTLRSPADRPLLREFDGGLILTAGQGRQLENPDARVSHAHTALLSQDSFAATGLHQVITLDDTGDHESGYMFRADLAPSNSQSASATGSISRTLAPGTSFQSAVNYQWHGDTSNDIANSLSSGTVRTVSTTRLPDGLTIEAGNELQNVTWGGHIAAAHPFANLTIASENGTSFTYSVSTAPGFARAADVDTTIERPALVSPSATGLTMEHGLHQSLMWKRQGENGMVSAAFYHDENRNPVLQGVATPSALASSGLIAGYDPVSGIFRETGGNYNAQGIALAAVRRVGPFQAEITFIDANTLLMSSKPAADTIETHHGNAQLATAAVRGRIPATRTQLAVAYGEETAGAIRPVDPFDIDAPAPFLNVLLRQPLHGRPGTPGSLEALIDLRNLFAQGYRPFVSQDGETLYLVQVPRSIEGGLAFSF